MRRLIISHLREEEVFGRVDLLVDPVVQAHFNHLAAWFSREELQERDRRTVRENQDDKRFFTVRTKKGALLGYCWITSIDWLNRTCELSIALLPQHRIGVGLVALMAMYDFLYNQMNMRVVVNQVLEGNTLLLSAEAVRRVAEVICEMDSFTGGRYRTAYLWTQTREDDFNYAVATVQRNRRIRALAVNQGLIPT